MTQAILHNEPELLSRIAQSDQSAFNELFEFYEPRVYSFVLRTTTSEMTAQEIVQDSFLKVWLKRDTLHTVDNFKNWLYTIAANLTQDALRRVISHDRLMHEVQQQAKSAGLFTPTEDLLLDKQYAELLESALKQLPARQREVFKLMKQQGLSRLEAAKALNLSDETVKTHIERAMQKIRAYCVVRLGTLGLLLFLWANR